MTPRAPNCDPWATSSPPRACTAGNCPREPAHAHVLADLRARTGSSAQPKPVQNVEQKHCSTEPSVPLTASVAAPGAHEPPRKVHPGLRQSWGPTRSRDLGGACRERHSSRSGRGLAADWRLGFVLHAKGGARGRRTRGTLPVTWGCWRRWERTVALA